MASFTHVWFPIEACDHGCAFHFQRINDVFYRPEEVTYNVERFDGSEDFFISQNATNFISSSLDEGNMNICDRTFRILPCFGSFNGIL